MLVDIAVPPKGCVDTLNSDAVQTDLSHQLIDPKNRTRLSRL